MENNAIIKGIAYYHPEQVVDNELVLEQHVRQFYTNIKSIRKGF